MFKFHLFPDAKEEFSERFLRQIELLIQEEGVTKEDYCRLFICDYVTKEVIWKEHLIIIARGVKRHLKHNKTLKMAYEEYMYQL